MIQVAAQELNTLYYHVWEGSYHALPSPRHTISIRGVFSFSFFLNFYCYSITVVCLLSPSLHPTPAESTSLPNVHPLSEISQAVRDKYHMISALTGT